MASDVYYAGDPDAKMLLDEDDCGVVVMDGEIRYRFYFVRCVYHDDPDAVGCNRGHWRVAVDYTIYEVADPDRAAFLPPDMRGGV